MKQSPLRLVALAVLLTAGGWVLVSAVQDLRAEWPALSARGAVAAWLADSRIKPSQGQWRAVELGLREAVQVQPDNPALQEALADAYNIGADQAWTTEADRERLIRLALEGYRRVLALRPRDARNWTALMSTHVLRGERGPVVNEAWAQARRHGPNESYLVTPQIRAVMATWDDATPEMRTWVADLYETGTQAQRELIARTGQPFGLAFSSTTPPRVPKRP